MCKKKELRRTLRTIPGGKDLAREQQIRAQMLGHPWYREAACVMGYLSIGYEVEIFPVLKAALASGKRVFVPRCYEGGVMDAVEIFGPEDLEAGMFGILEPKAERKVENPEVLDLIFVPGMAFDRDCNRLGRGAGYYDRFLERASNAKTIGICVSERVLQQVPTDLYDRKMDALITENGLIHRKVDE